MQKQHPGELAACFEAARRIHKRHGTSYYFATQLFPRDIRLATYALYAFLRVPDEIVDARPLRTQADVTDARRRLAAWRAAWEAAYATGDAENPVLRVNAYLFHAYDIPLHYSAAFLDSMDRDLVQATYRDYADLEGYMYGSAGVVGILMAYLIGFRDESALAQAQKLGYAMQLTNFLRDIDEDYQVRRRVYLPQDELRSFGLSNDDIAARRFSRNFREFMIFQSERVNRLYAEADTGIPLLRREGRLPVRVAAVLYGAILNKLEERDWNVFEGRARTSLPEKVVLTMGAALRERYA